MRMKKIFFNDVRGQEMPQNGFLCGLSTPWGPLWARKIWDFHILRRSPRRITYKKISRTPVQQTPHFWKKHVFFNFSRFLRKYRVSVYISIIYAPNEAISISIDPEEIVGNYIVLIFFLFHQVDELQNQKCGTHNKKLAAMKFRNSEKISYCSNQLERFYL